jgi:hypothetical protein
MTIRILPEPDIYLTPGEHARLRREYAKLISMCVDPPTFEEFVRSRQPQKQANATPSPPNIRPPKGGKILPMPTRNSKPSTTCALKGEV